MTNHLESKCHDLRRDGLPCYKNSTTLLALKGFRFEGILPVLTQLQLPTPVEIIFLCPFPFLV